MLKIKTNTNVGYYQIHTDVSLNYQMNRFYDGSPEMLADMKKASLKIKDYTDYTRHFLQLSEEAFSNNNDLRGALYLRSAEFYMFPDDPRKNESRLKFIKAMRKVYGIGAREHHNIDYSGGYMGAYRLTPKDAKGTLVLFGGFDSYAEEIFGLQQSFYQQGYDIIIFEGPGQGSTLEEAHLPMTPNWEEPVGAVLDHFKLDDVTLIGYSLGGCLAVRAAAHTPRVKRVICDDILTDFMAVTFRQISPLTRLALRTLLFLKATPAVNTLVHRAMSKSLVSEWGVKQGMHTTGTKSPYEFMRQVMLYETLSVASKVTQDVLLLGASEDHYVPVSQFYDQVGSITNARSLTARLFTRDEQAQNHVQIGNTALALSVMTDWLDQLIARDQMMQKDES